MEWIDKQNSIEDMAHKNHELNMSVSPVCVKDGKQYAFVTFSDGKRLAEGKIPACKIISNDGFGKDEVEQLEAYMHKELQQLKKMAAGIRIIDAFMK
ncbi:MAG: hypothetical protein IJ485_04935 [Lachnospiraceae bacterium]|nr:hypothetical protein [Lachnospiraceae bacterium]